MFDFFLSPFSEDIGIDLGTANTHVYVRGKGIVVREASVVAIHKKTGAVLAVGKEAKKMVGKTPENIMAIRPLREGVISDFEIAEKMLRLFIRRVHESPSRFPRIFHPRIVVGIPSGITEVERRAVRDAAQQSGAREVYLVEEPMAAALGSGLPITAPEGSLIVDIGGGTTEIAVISLGGIVVGKNLRVAGDKMTEAIAQYAREKYNLLLGEQTAEKVKIEVGNAILTGPTRAKHGSNLKTKHESGSEETLPLGVMRGRDLKTGLPKAVVLSPDEAKEALSGSLARIVDAVKGIIEATPPELLSDVLERGVTLAGGGALLRGIDQLLAKEAEVPVRVASDPMTCVVRGCGKALEDRNLLERIRVR